MIGSHRSHATGSRPRRGASFRRRAGRGAPTAFTLAEAIVLLGIVVLLAALLLPTISRIRQTARDVVCSGRLHDLSVACTTYFVVNDRYPTPYRGVVGAMTSSSGLQFTPSNLPQAVDLNLVNALAPYFKYPPIGPTLAGGDLPPPIQSPPVEAISSGRGPYPSGDASDPVYYAGYVYAARIGEWPNLLYVSGALRQTSNGSPSSLSTGPLTFPGVIGRLNLPSTGLPPTAIQVGIMLKPDRTAQSPSTDRGVIWADDVHLSASPSGYWQYSHVKRRVAPGPVPSSYLDPSGCRGQHRCYVDGSVEWVSGAELGLDSDKKVADATATYRLWAGYWWF